MKSFKISLILLTLLMLGCTGTRPENLGLADNQFQKCPDKPNCISSQAIDEDHRQEPIPTDIPITEQKAKLKAVIETNFPRAKLVKEQDNYLYYEFTSLLFRYVDDVEFFFSEAEPIHFRSASRLGTSDLGANKKRIDKIKAGF